MKMMIKVFSKPCSKRIGYSFTAVLLSILAPGLAGQPLSGESFVETTPRSPSLNPPREERPLSSGMFLEKSVTVAPAAVPTVEWTYHRTADGQHPNGDEQQIVWLMNRARQDPTAEGVWLATSTEPSVANGRNFFQVNIQMLQQEFASYAAKPPAAFDVRLYNAAKAHSDDLIVRDAQDHNNQFERIDDAGFQWFAVRGSVYSYAADALNAHAAWNIDWGSGPSGMQTGRGHRMATMSIDGNYTNVGIAAVPESSPGTDVGPLVVTGNYCEARENGVDHFNRFIVGTVWQDQNDNDRYDPGEGLANILVTPNQGDYFALTAAGGGYAIPMVAPGAYQLTFSGSGVNATLSVQVDTESVLLDLRTDQQTNPDAATTLITHYYVSILERPPEADGLAFWQNQIIVRQENGEDVKPVFRNMANFFFNSPEYLARNTTDTQFTTNLYLTFFQREPEANGLAFWLDRLANGEPRNDVMDFFLYSKEFLDFMLELGF